MEINFPGEYFNVSYWPFNSQMMAWWRSSDRHSFQTDDKYSIIKACVHIYCIYYNTHKKTQPLKWLSKIKATIKQLLKVTLKICMSLHKAIDNVCACWEMAVSSKYSRNIKCEALSSPIMKLLNVKQNPGWLYTPHSLQLLISLISIASIKPNHRRPTLIV